MVIPIASHRYCARAITSGVVAPFVGSRHRPVDQLAGAHSGCARRGPWSADSRRSTRRHRLPPRAESSKSESPRLSEGRKALGSIRAPSRVAAPTASGFQRTVMRRGELVIELNPAPSGPRKKRADRSTRNALDRRPVALLELLTRATRTRIIPADILPVGSADILLLRRVKRPNTTSAGDDRV